MQVEIHRYDLGYLYWSLSLYSGDVKIITGSPWAMTYLNLVLESPDTLRDKFFARAHEAKFELRPPGRLHDIVS